MWTEITVFPGYPTQLTCLRQDHSLKACLLVAVVVVVVAVFAVVVVVVVVPLYRSISQIKTI